MIGKLNLRVIVQWVGGGLALGLAVWLGILANHFAGRAMDAAYRLTYAFSGQSPREIPQRPDWADQYIGVAFCFLVSFAVLHVALVIYDVFLDHYSSRLGSQIEVMHAQLSDTQRKYDL